LERNVQEHFGDLTNGPRGHCGKAEHSIRAEATIKAKRTYYVNNQS